MEILTIIFFTIVALYSILILWLSYGFKKIKVFQNNSLQPITKFSIIVPFRNEAQNLPSLLHSFSQLDYPRSKFEIIFVNDASEDNSVEVIANFPASSFSFSIIDTIRKSNSPKKDAIETAIEKVSHDWIVTTDADCFVDQNWLKTLDNYVQIHNPKMIAGTVSVLANDSFLEQFQQLDLMSLQGATIGSFGINKGFMCNGANFAYTKKSFQELDGFIGNNQISSGDDVFLLQKAMAKYPEKVHYLKSEDAVVLTKPVNDWSTLFFQRVRWASKSSSYQSVFGKIVALIVFAGNFVIVLSFFLTLVSAFSFWIWYLLFAIKIFIDFLLLNQAGKFLKPRTIKFFLISNLVYPFFSTSVALYSLFGKYRWKGRSLR